MGSEGMVQELERLRKLLDVTPANQLRQDGTGGASASETVYTRALSAAEVGLAPPCAFHRLSPSVTSRICCVGHCGPTEWCYGIWRRRNRCSFQENRCKAQQMSQIQNEMDQQSSDLSCFFLETPVTCLCLSCLCLHQQCMKGSAAFQPSTVPIMNCGVCTTS